MPVSALDGTFDLPGWTGATITAGSFQHTNSALATIFHRGPVPLVVDIETFGLGLDARRLKCVTLSTDRSAVVLDPRTQADAWLIAQAIEMASWLIMHKANFDAPNLAWSRLLHPHHVDKIVDTMVEARLATPGDTVGRTLDDLLKRYLGMVNRPIMDLFRSLGYKTKQAGYEGLDIDSPAYLMGAASDGIGTARVWPHVHAAAVDRQLQHPFTHGLNRAEAEELVAEAHEANRWGLERTLDGVLADLDYLERFRAHTGAGREQAAALLRADGIDPGNGAALVTRLEALGEIPLDHRRTPFKIHPTTSKVSGGKLGAAQKDLESLSHPLATAHAEVATTDKLLGYLQKCVDLMDANGRIHPVTDVLAAGHGRDSMADPPIHQFPELARPIILADPGRTFTSVDWSQQEPRIAMNLAGDHAPLLAYEQYGTKVYTAIAEMAETTGDMAKKTVLAGLYGQGYKLLSNQLGLPYGDWKPGFTKADGTEVKGRYTFEAAKEIQDAVFSAIPMTAEFMRRGKQIARQHQLAWTVAGRIVPIPSGTYDGVYSVQTHKWINYCVSGSAADELHRVVVLARRAGLGMGLKWGMHDELVVDTEIAYDVQRLMQTPSERFCRLSKRVPVIRTDMELMGRTWVKPH